MIRPARSKALTPSRTGGAWRAAAERLAAVPEPALLAGLFAAAAALSATTILNGINLNDEGLMLGPAARIAAGEVPYRDFFLVHSPGQPYLLAGLWELFGPSLLAWRVVRVLADAAVSVLVYKLARRHAQPPLALLAWVAAAGAMASPSGPNPFAPALALALGALLAVPRSAVLAGALAGLCAVWRIDLAAYLWLGILCSYLMHRDEGRGEALRFAGSAALTSGVLFAPVVWQAGIAGPWEMLVRHPLGYASDQVLPLTLDYEGGLSGAIPWGLRSSAGHLLLFYLPPALLAGSAAALVLLWIGLRREAWPDVAVWVFTLGAANYLLVRADEYHTAPLAVMFCVLASWALAHRGGVPVRHLRPALAAVTAIVLGWVAVQGLERWVREAQTEHVPVRLAVADGVRGLPSGRCGYEAATAVCSLEDLERAVGHVRERVPAGRPIYVATRRSDLVTSGAPLLYVLAERPNPTRYDVLPPRLVTAATTQREIIGDLEAAGLPLVVRFAAPITAAPEPNRAGRSSGVRLLDGFLGRRYRRTARFGFYLILERRR